MTISSSLSLPTHSSPPPSALVSMQSFDRVGKTSVCLISARLIPKDRWESGNGGWWFQGFNTGKKMVALLINSVVSNRYNRPCAEEDTECQGIQLVYERERDRERDRFLVSNWQGRYNRPLPVHYECAHRFVSFSFSFLVFVSFQSGTIRNFDILWGKPTIISMHSRVRMFI